MTAAVTVVGVGCELDRLFSGQSPALPIPGAPGRDDLRDLYDAIGGPLRGGRSVIVVLGDWLPEQTLERIYMVRSLLGSDRVAVHVTPLPPLAASVLAALAAALSDVALSAGVLAGALDSVAAELPVLAWAGSVAGLRHPSVSLLHHARSVLPWATFAIGVQPEPFVQTTNGDAAELPVTPPTDPVSLLVAPGPSADLSWVTDSLVPAFRGAPVRQLPPTLHGEDWWGTGRLIEVVGVPNSLDRLAEATLPTRVIDCRWCGEPIASQPCPFCGDALGTAVARQNRNPALAGADYPTDRGA